MGWIRVGRSEWQQYVGRRVRRLRVGSGAVYVAWAGNLLCGVHGTLELAMRAAEEKRG